MSDDFVTHSEAKELFDKYTTKLVESDRGIFFTSSTLNLKNKIVENNGRFIGRNLIGFDFRGATLRYANFTGANLAFADFDGADLTGCNFENANLIGVSACSATFKDVRLKNANIKGMQIDYSFDFPFEDFPINCPTEGSFIGYKKVFNPFGSPCIAVLEIPSDAERTSCPTSRVPKLRCSKAKVIRFETFNGKITENVTAHSNYDPNFIYHLGDTIVPDHYCDDRRTCCASGIHFFLDRTQAINYEFC